MILRYLALSENDIIYLKNIPKVKYIENKNRIISRLKIKFIFFYLIGLLFLAMFWYYVSVFCAVYINTQILLIKDTAITFFFFLTYPFILYLFPACFRIPAIRCKNGICLYKFSKIIEFF